MRKSDRGGAVVCVPAPILTEATTGNGTRDAKTNRALKSCVVTPLDEALAREAGTLRFRHPKAGAVDAMVIACADAVPDSVVLTGALKHMQILAAERDRTFVIGC